MRRHHDIYMRSTSCLRRPDVGGDLPARRRWRPSRAPPADPAADAGERRQAGAAAAGRPTRCRPCPARSCRRPTTSSVPRTCCIVFWRDKDISCRSRRAARRQDLAAARQRRPGRGPHARELRLAITKAARESCSQDEPTVSVGVKAINSRKVFIRARLASPGPYPLNSQLDVLQLITMAGGLNEYADKREHPADSHRERRAEELPHQLQGHRAGQEPGEEPDVAQSRRPDHRP